MKFFKKFKNKSDYNAYMKNIKVVLPNISYIVENEDVKFNEKPHYISMIASASQTVKAPSGSTMEYSYNMETWSAMTAAVSFGTEGKERVYIRGKNATGLKSQRFIFGNTTAKVSLDGNCQSLLDWETLPTAVPISGFTRLFSGATALQSVGKDFLPATTLANSCYQFMFANCNGLESAPLNLPARTLPTSCYASIFDWDANLTTIPPIVSADEIGFESCRGMFYHCSSITGTPNLNITTLSASSFYDMFNGCTSLKQVTCSATSINALNSVKSWLNGVASSGHFHGKSAANWPDGPSGIPNGWTKHLS